MNEASRWRIETARRLASVYAGQPGVRMVVAGGSAAPALLHFPMTPAFPP